MKEKNGEHPFGDAGQLILLALFLLVWIADSFITHTSTFLSEHLPLYIRLIISILAIALALFLFKESHVVVSHDNRPDGILTTGVFRHVRHPLYLAGIMFYLGLISATISIFSSVILVFILIFYNYIASYEEKLLEEKYGEEYLDYKRRTGKWIPRFI